MFKTKITIRFTVLSTFLFVVILITSIALGMHYYFSQQLAKSAAADQFIQIAERVGERALSLENAGISMTELLQNSPLLLNPVKEKESLPIISLMASAIKHNNGFYSAFAGYADGSYVQLTNLESSQNVRKTWGASPKDRWLEVRILRVNNALVRIKRYLDDELRLRTQKKETTQYDPRLRPWYKLATIDSVTKTPPYLFTFIKAPGVSYSMRTRQNTVVGVQVALSGLAELLDNRLYPDTSQAFMFNNKGIVTTSKTSQSTQRSIVGTKVNLTQKELNYIALNPVVRVANETDYPPFDFTVSGLPRGFSIDLINLVAKKTGLKLKFTNGLPFPKLLNGFKQGELDLMLTMRRTQQRETYGLFTTPTVESNMVIVSSFHDEEIFTSISQLAGKIVAAQRDYAVYDYLLIHHPELNFLEVPDTLTGMRLIAEGKADVILEMDIVVDYIRKHYFLEKLKLSSPLKELSEQASFSLHQFVAKDKPVLHTILNKALAAISAEEMQQLKNKWLYESSNINESASVNELAMGQLPHRQLLEIAQNYRLQNELHEVEIGEQIHYAYVSTLTNRVTDEQEEFIGMIVNEEEVLAPYLKQIQLALVITLLALFLLIPVVLYLASLIVSPVRQLKIENDKIKNRQFDDIYLVDTNIKEISELSTSMSYMASSIQAYQESQKTLMEAFIKLIAQAVDEKSPYTGGHCERVPELAFMLAEAACNSNAPTFRDFSFANKEEWREFKVAAWLHDCGKVTTPEHIVDKGSKLEAIYNRIHEIRMRFEVLWRDAEISYFKQLAKEPNNPVELKQQLDEKIASIKSDFAFVATCNVGGESMDKAHIQRLEEIGTLSWERRLDSRMGLSPKDELTFSDELHQTPAMETILMDKAEHISLRKSVRRRDEKFGFTMTAPTHLQNLGELYNLSIERGTLTTEDRYIINEHIINTIQTLETLPLPDDLKRVPEYAGGHHETLTGKGYPRGLSADDLSIPARILAIADIFEALTASDRPYKKSKTLSSSLEILHKMSKNRHIDKDLFELFLTSGVYQHYAEKYLLPEQINEVNIQLYLS